MSWYILESRAPDIAEFSRTRLHNQVAYLATIRKDGSPRLHPFTPIIGEGHFFVFMEPTSPKGHDLRRDGRFAIHCSVTDTSGESGEVILTGKAKLIQDLELRALAVNRGRASLRSGGQVHPSLRILLAGGRSLRVDVNSIERLARCHKQPIALWSTEANIAANFG